MTPTHPPVREHFEWLATMKRMLANPQLDAIRRSAFKARTAKNIGARSRLIKTEGNPMTVSVTLNGSALTIEAWLRNPASSEKDRIASSTPRE